MLKQLVIFAFGGLCGAFLMFGTLKYHVVHASDGWHLIEKADASLGETFVDIRGFDYDDWQKHPQLIVAIGMSEKAYLLSGPSDLYLDEVARQIWD